MVGCHNGRRGTVTLQYVADLTREVAQASELTSLEAGDVNAYIDREERRVTVNDPREVSAEILLKLVYDEVAALGKMALAVEVALQRQLNLSSRFALEIKNANNISIK